jgi:hypothetical protein
MHLALLRSLADEERRNTSPLILSVLGLRDNYEGQVALRSVLERVEQLTIAALRISSWKSTEEVSERSELRGEKAHLGILPDTTLDNNPHAMLLVVGWSWERGNRDEGEEVEFVVSSCSKKGASARQI